MATPKEEDRARGRNYSYPYVYLLMLNKLNLTHKPHSGVKTASRSAHASPDVYTFLRTSGSIAYPMVLRHIEIDRPTKQNTKVINGVARLVETRELTETEQYLLFLMFNNLLDQTSSKKLFHNEIQPHCLEPGLVWPFPNGYFYEDVRAFQKPVPFEIPPGAVNVFTIAKRPLLAKALHGIDLKWNDVVKKEK